MGTSINKDYISKENKRLTKIFKDIDPKKKQTVQGLIEEAAFMRGTMNALKEDLLEEGPIDEMCQGEYTILREHPSAKLYNTTIQRYTAIIDKLTNLLPKDVPKNTDDGFDGFMGG
ncbi:hypothetical protein CS063_13710 [Sporanaerobium hydrogeniformans]|uniref:Uncharacterized protein n=1 Tax=Sporanaerobium hydrogeniformans TaxID=3072179 RepID=A0AC61DA54_9FIRM|nr:hypothetical protein [Sporanaerobium hydrogeniformans]PHV69770.1 hypothetical protein CS063_13710 [Sporanaerobium hydrogeniformans]